MLIIILLSVAFLLIYEMSGSQSKFYIKLDDFRYKSYGLSGGYVRQ